MAVPADVTVQNMSGLYMMNKKQSDSMNSLLKQQNVGFVVRQVTSYANIETKLAQFTSDDGKKHLDQTQTAPGTPANFEDRLMDWEWGDKETSIWGKVKGRNRYIKPSEVEDEWLREGWDGDEVVETFVESATSDWTAWQIWGFAIVEGEKKHVRKIVGKRPGYKDEKVKMVYDWKDYLPK